MNRLEAQVRRKAILVAAEKRAREVSERGPDLSGAEAIFAVVGTVDVLVDKVIALESEIEKMRRRARGHS